LRNGKRLKKIWRIKMCKDHRYPKELKRSHSRRIFERMVRRMVADRREVEKLVERLVAKSEEVRDEPVD
jgi:ribosomal protein L13